MPNLEVITRDNFKNRKWESPKNYLFAASDTLCPLTPAEAPRAALHLPIAFAVIQEKLTLVAVLGFTAGKNYLVDSQGRWLAGYIPAPYRAYPFFIATTPQSEEVLCIDADSKLIDTANAVNDFFDINGNPITRITEILEFLGEMSQSRKSLNNVLTLFQNLDLLETWPIELNDDDKKIKLEGLLRVNEERLNNLVSEQFESLREAGALPLIYTQLLSMQNIHRVAYFGNANTPNQDIPAELDFDLSNDSGTISFSSL